MKKLVIASALVLSFTACQKNEKIVSDTKELDSVTVADQDSVAVETLPVSKNQTFLKKFRQIELDSTAFIAPEYGDNSTGPAITHEEIALFPETLSLAGFSNPDVRGFEAHSKFDINENLMGIVARMPGEYSFTSLKLFFYDKTKDAFLPQYFELADIFGDAGYYEEVKSWLWKDGENLKSLLYRQTKVEKIEPDDPVRESKTEDYYLVKLNPAKMDSSRVSKDDLQAFQKLIQR